MRGSVPFGTSSPFAGSSCGLSRHKIPKQPYGIGTQSPGNLNEFDHVYSALAALILGNERLGPAELPCQGLLTDIGILPHCDKGRNQPGVFRRFEGFLHAPPSQRFGGTQSDPEIGLSQNWILSGN
jgi:hypothetical protein